MSTCRVSVSVLTRRNPTARYSAFLRSSDNFIRFNQSAVSLSRNASNLKKLPLKRKDHVSNFPPFLFQIAGLIFLDVGMMLD